MRSVEAAATPSTAFRLSIASLSFRRSQAVDGPGQQEPNYQRNGCRDQTGPHEAVVQHRCPMPVIPVELN
jgi:hypothetical protein